MRLTFIGSLIDYGLLKTIFQLDLIFSFIIASLYIGVSETNIAVIDHAQTLQMGFYLCIGLLIATSILFVVYANFSQKFYWLQVELDISESILQGNLIYVWFLTVSTTYLIFANIVQTNRYISYLGVFLIVYSIAGFYNAIKGTIVWIALYAKYSYVFENEDEYSALMMYIERDKKNEKKKSQEL